MKAVDSSATDWYFLGFPVVAQIVCCLGTAPDRLYFSTLSKRQ